MKRLLLSVALLPLGGMAAAQCAPDFTGVRLNVSTQNGPAIASPLIEAARVWEQQTCGQVNMVEFPFGELFPVFLTSMMQQTGGFDVIGFVPAWLPDFAAFLTTMPEELREGADWEDIHPTFRERLMVWEGEVKSATMDGDMHMLNLRSDLLDDPDEQAAFEERFGYPLAKPTTWAEYRDHAEFFTRPDEGMFGTAEAFRRGGQQFWYFFSRAAAYTNHPDNPGAMFFDPETMDAQLGNPGWVRALEEFIDILQFNPPGALNNGSGDVRPLYAGGTVAMNIDWADSAVLRATEGGPEAEGTVRTAMLPGSTEIWNHVTGEWDTFDEVIHSPFLAFGGWQLGVPADSRNQEAAWHFVSTVIGPELSTQFLVMPNSGVNPFRFSHYENLDVWSAIFTEEEAASYLGAQQASLDAPNVALDLRLPGFFSYTEVLEIELSRALAGQVSPQEALEAIAAEWNNLTDEFGRDTQLAAYRASVGLPPLE